MLQSSVTLMTTVKYYAVEEIQHETGILSGVVEDTYDEYFDRHDAVVVSAEINGDGIPVNDELSGLILDAYNKNKEV